MKFNTVIILQFRSQWRRSLRRGFAAACLLELWVRIPPGAWMYVCCEGWLLLGRGRCDGLITRPEESYRMWCVWFWSWILDNQVTLVTTLLSHGKRKFFTKIYLVVMSFVKNGSVIVVLWWRQWISLCAVNMSWQILVCVCVCMCLCVCVNVKPSCCCQFRENLYSK
jgi:hypothetical protein